MPKTIAFLFSGKIESPTNLALLTGMDALDKSQYTPIAFVEDMNGSFTKKLQKQKLKLVPFQLKCPVDPKASRLKGAWQTFRNSLMVLMLVKHYQIDFVVSAEMGLILAFSPGVYAAHKKIIWMQESLWEDYPIAELWSGYMGGLFVSSEKVLKSLPPSLQYHAKILEPPSFETTLKKKEIAKNYIETLLKDCN